MQLASGVRLNCVRPLVKVQPDREREREREGKDKVKGIGREEK